MATQPYVGGIICCWAVVPLVFSALYRIVLVRLFLIGFCMGIADLIPGVSGGTIAFICGIYDEMLMAIKSLQIHSLKAIHWRFILLVGGGLVTAVLLFARLFYHLMVNYQAPLYAFFFGVIAASALFCFKKAKLRGPLNLSLLSLSAVAGFLVAGLNPAHFFGGGLMALFFSGSLAACAMLLPGISGSYVLHLLGIYPLLLAALSAPRGSFSLLIVLGFGVAFGFVLFSRIVHWLMTYFYATVLAVLVGLMCGGMRSLWVFSRGGILIPLAFTVLGFFVVLFLEMKGKERFNN